MAIMHMLTLLPSGPDIDPALPAELNRVMDIEYDRIRDFLILHYVANDADAALWQRVTTMTVPDTLAGKIDRFRSEEHTSELQSLMSISYAVFCLKKKKTNLHSSITKDTLN